MSFVVTTMFTTGKQLIRDMMQVDPAARVTARQVKDDPWLTVIKTYNIDGHCH